MRKSKSDHISMAWFWMGVPESSSRWRVRSALQLCASFDLPFLITWPSSSTQ